MPVFPLTLHKTYLEQGFFNVTVFENAIPDLIGAGFLVQNAFVL